jgi:hypothetical protein
MPKTILEKYRIVMKSKDNETFSTGVMGKTAAHNKHWDSIQKNKKHPKSRKWKKIDMVKEMAGRPRGEAHIENIRFWDLSNEELRYIIKDANEAIKANPKARKATSGKGNWADQVNDASTVLAHRNKKVGKFIGKFLKKKGKLKEDAPTNATGPAVPGTGDTGDAWKKGTLLRRKKFAGQDVFEVTSDTYSKSIQGKAKFKHWRTYVGECETGVAIREFALQNPKSPIIIQNELTGAMCYIKYGGK